MEWRALHGISIVFATPAPEGYIHPDIGIFYFDFEAYISVDIRHRRNYCNYIGRSVVDAKLVDIGNSKGIRLPKKLIERYHLKEKLTLEELDDGILIRAEKPQDMLSWEETFREMAQENEDWSDFDNLASDGIE
jgi:antitoxin MazE